MSTCTNLIKIRGGGLIPALGLGTWRSKPEEIEIAVTAALKAGYRHFDCASVYENEKDIGHVLRSVQNDYPRASLFLTSKLWNTFHEPHLVKKACQQSLSDLQTSYLDLYLVHWPVAHQNAGDGNSVKDPKTNKSVLNTTVTLEQTWSAMESLVDEGLVRAIGVSNFTIEHLKRILKVARIRPAVNQIELHPYLPQDELVAFCKLEGIVVEAYSPLGSSPGEGKIFSDETVVQMAKKYNATPAQVLISWGVLRGTVVLPKSSNPGRIESNGKILNLSTEDRMTLNDLHETVKTVRYVDPRPWWDVDVFGSSLSASL